MYRTHRQRVRKGELDTEPGAGGTGARGGFFKQGKEELRPGLGTHAGH